MNVLKKEIGIFYKEKGNSQQEVIMSPDIYMRKQFKIHIKNRIGKADKISIIAIESKIYFLKSKPKVIWEKEYLFKNPLN